MIRGFFAGVFYCLTVFLLALPLGPVRAFFVSPVIGSTPSMLLEAALVALVAWLLCWLFQRLFRIRDARTANTVMAVVTFVGFFIGDAVVSHVAGRSWSYHFAGYRALGMQVEMASWLLIAAFPILRSRRVRRQETAEGVLHSSAR